MSNARPLLVTAYLTSPLAGDPPQLDALLEWALSPFAPDYQRSRGMWRAGQFRDMDPRYQFKLTRAGPAPPQGEIKIPLGQVWIGGWLVGQCSNPILPRAVETVNYVNKRLAVEAAGLLAPEERKIVSTTNSWTKSYRLPLRVRVVSCVRWFAVAIRRNLLKALREVHALGKKVADGYGRVRGWEVVDAAEDWTWFAPHQGGRVLMRTLPLLVDGKEWLPKDLLGWRRDYGACRPPYWHPDRNGEIVIPC